LFYVFNHIFLALVSQTLLSIKELVSDVSRAVDALIKEFNLGMTFVLLQVSRLAIFTAIFTASTCSDLADDSQKHRTLRGIGPYFRE
jgi:hypothetical protein